MSKITYYLKSPFLISAIFCAICFYSGLIPLKEKNEFRSPVPVENVRCISGTICLNPSKSSTGKCYTSKISLENINFFSGKMEIKTEASGQIPVRIPFSVVESVYPGKLYSLADGSALIENGEKISCTGNWSQKYGSFVVDSVVYEGHGNGFLGEIQHFRALCRLVFKRLMFSWGLAGGLVLSLLSGSREYLEPGIGDSFRKAGLSHILALSGMHLSFFSGLVGGIGKNFGKKIMPFFQLFGIIFFVWFAGLSPSLFRALLCSLITLAGKMVFCKKLDTLEVLSCAFLIHCVVIPRDLFSVGFMLSYGALAGILIFAELLNLILAPVFPPKISSSLAASTGAQIATCPISVKVFGSFAPVGIVSTVFVSPLINIFITISLVFMVLSFAFPFLSSVFGSIMNGYYGAVAWIVKVFAKVPPISFDGR